MSAQRPKSLAQINVLADKLRSSMVESSDGSTSKTPGKQGKTEFGSINMSDVPYGNLQELYTELLERYRKAQQEKDEMMATAERRQDAYLRKEKTYQDQLDNLEERVQTVKVDADKEDSHMGQIRGLHTDILEAINTVQGKTSMILKAQERDLIRAFRARLADVTDELEKERKKNESGSVEWVQRCRKLTEELEWLRDLTEKLTSENKSYLKENRRFKRQLKTQEEDREFLIKQLVTVKKENARLRHTYEQVTGHQAEQSDLPSPSPSGRQQLDFDSARSTPQSTARRPRQQAQAREPSRDDNRTSDTPREDQEAKFKQRIARLKRQIEQEATKTRALRTAYTQQVATRTELQNFLKKCIEDVRTDLFHRVKRGGKGGHKLPLRPSIDPRLIPVDEFTPQDRITVMEWLLSQDHVIYMLYDRMFPRGGAGVGGGNGLPLDATMRSSMGASMMERTDGSTFGLNSVQSPG